MAEPGSTVVQAIATLEAQAGGPSRSVPALARGLHAQGYDVRFLLQRAPRQPSSEARRAISDGIACTTAGLGGARLVHVHGIWVRFIHDVARAAYTRQLPVVISPRGMLEPWALAHHGLRKRLAMLLYQRRDLNQATLLHATSELEAESLRKLRLGPPIAVIPNGTEVADLSVEPAFKAEGARRLLFLSRLHPKKGAEDLLVVASQLGDALRAGNWHLTIAGPDANGHRAELERTVARLGVGDRVHFVGEVSGQQKWSLLRSADLFVLPTHSENFGLVVAEALSAGVPVITTTGAPWAELNSAHCGLWCDVGREPLRHALETALALGDDERRQMGERGRQLVIEQYSWQRVCDMFHATYSWVLGAGSKPGWVQ